MRRIALLAASLPALLLCACGKTIETSDLEAKIARQITVTQHAAPRSVDCPSDIKAKKGRTFTCTVTRSDGSRAPAPVKLLDDEGRFSFVPPPPAR
jgi:hypothetical protein